MELKRDSALLDKVVIYDFSVVNVEDAKKLQKQGILCVKEGMPVYLSTDSGFQYSSITLENFHEIEEFCYGVTVSGQPYGRVVLTVPDDGFHNLNCCTPEEYIDTISIVQGYLISEYGIQTDFQNAKYKSIEINKTININGLFPEYQRVLTLMMYLLPAKLRLHGEADYSSKDHSARMKVTNYSRCINTYCKESGQRGISVKIYDKSRQLEEVYNILVTEEYLRYEVTLRSPEKIKAYLGTNSIFSISESDIKSFFKKFIYDNVYLPYAEHKRKLRIELVRLLKRNYIKGDRKWINRVLLQIADAELGNRSIPLMLDIEELLSAIDEVKFDSKQIKANAKSRFREEAASQIPTFANGDTQKYKEVVNKLLGETCL